MNERPKLVGLNVARVNVADASVKERAALLSDSQEQGKNRALMRSSEARDRAHAHPFQQKLHDFRGLFCRDVVAFERLVARLRERGLAGGATITLDAIAAESKSPCFGVLALYTRHGLLFLREKPYNQSLGSECGLRSRLDSALLIVDAIGRALALALVVARKGFGPSTPRLVIGRSFRLSYRATTSSLNAFSFPCFSCWPAVRIVTLSPARSPKPAAWLPR